MDEFTFQLQLVFMIGLVIPFLIKKEFFNWLPSAVDRRTNELSLPRAIAIFFIASIVQLLVVWLGNMSELPSVGFFAHLIAGGIFGAGLRLATLRQ